MAPSGSIWHKESLKLKEIFGTREGFEICPNNFSPRPNFSPPGTPCQELGNWSGFAVCLPQIRKCEAKNAIFGVYWPFALHVLSLCLSPMRRQTLSHCGT